MTNIVLGVTGSIAVYKAADLVRQLIKAGFNVKVVMTHSAKQFVHPNTFATLSQNPVYDDLFAKEHDPMMHIHLAKWADLVLIAPVSAATISRLAQGASDDLLSTVCLATTAKVMLAPAMNQAMWSHWAVQANVQTLQQNQVTILNPEAGEQACGDVGVGRLIDNELIVEAVIAATLPEQVYKNKNILITAGPTQEAIDPVRFISNHSSGKMGFALAKAAKAMGAKVTLITGPTTLPAPDVDQLITINSAKEMLDAVLTHIDHQDMFICAAAVADYRPKAVQNKKIKKQQQTMTLELEKTTDILTTIGQRKNKPKLVGFAAETNNVLEYAKKKLKQKNLDAIIANEVNTEGYPFYADSNQVTLIKKDQSEQPLPKADKYTLAMNLLKLLSEE